MDSVIFNILFLAVILMAIIFLIIGNKQNSGMTKKQKTMLVRILAATVILLVLQSLSAETFNKLDQFLFPYAGRWIRLLCYLIDYAIIGCDIIQKALKGIKNGQVFDENFLMAVATVGALSLAVYENGEYLLGLENKI
jgi:Zn2+/Cd2+-exporting ATPase